MVAWCYWVRVKHWHGRFPTRLGLCKAALEFLNTRLERSDIAAFLPPGKLVVGAGTLGGLVGLLTSSTCRKLAVTFDFGGTAARAGGNWPADA